GVVFALKAQSRFSASMFTPSLDVLLERDWDRKYWQISQQATQQNVSIITGVPVYIVDYLSQLELNHKDKLGLGDQSIPEIWPNLKLVVWGGATLDSYHTRLTELLGGQVDYWETYGATEPGLIAYQADREPGMMPALDMVFLEFIPLTEWRAMEAEGGEYQTFDFTYHTLQDVKPGVNYVIVMTTLGGMYRYIIGDTVAFQSTNPPRLSWSGRLVWYSNITLERMNYGHVEQMIHLLGETFGCLFSNFSYATSYDPPRYHFIIEPDQHTDYSGDLAASIDQYLMEVNAEYQFCRERQFLQAPKATLVPPGTYRRLEQFKIREKTNKLGHFKPPRFTNLQTLELLNSIAVSRGY
ncbi:MAG: GH3 auxin-responsive promoter family protein, partial [Candidatus Hodarchaeota archaeon]